MRTGFLSVRSLVLLAAIMLGGNSAVAGSIIFSTDTPTTLRGSFSVTGTDYVERLADNFQLLPEAAGSLHVYRGRTIEGVGPSGLPAFLAFLTPKPGIGSIQTQREEIYEFAAQDFGPHAGYYLNSLPPDFINLIDYPGPVIHVLFSNWHDTGGVDGTFSGSFCFSTSESECSTIPEPSGIAVLGSGVAALWVTWRRRRQSQPA